MKILKNNSVFFSYNVMGDIMNSSVNHALSVSDRSNINISGVNKVENFDKEEFLLETVMGYMEIKGESLEMVKLDTIEGKVVIKGKVNSINYLENIKKSKNKEESLLNRLFK